MEDLTTVLVVTPHPDDAESGAGGTIARWTAQGRKVVLVVCTNGDKGTGDRTIAPKTLAKTREKEQMKAAEVLGISEVVFLKFPDQGLEDCSEFREKIVRQIRIHKPHTVLTTDLAHEYIRHRDHYIAGRVTLDAVFPYARDHLSFPEHLEEGLDPHNVQEVFLWRPQDPDTFLDITETFETKIQALRCHSSQVRGLNEERRERMRSRHEEIGKKVGVQLAEQFKRIELWR